MIFLFFSKKVDLFLRTQKFHMIFQHCGEKNLAKIWLPGDQKSHFFKINKGSRFGLLRFGSVLKSRKRFGRFEVRFTRGSGGSRFGIFRFDPTLVADVGTGCIITRVCVRQYKIFSSSDDHEAVIIPDNWWTGARPFWNSTYFLIVFPFCLSMFDTSRQSGPWEWLFSPKQKSGMTMMRRGRKESYILMTSASDLIIFKEDDRH